MEVENREKEIIIEEKIKEDEKENELNNVLREEENEDELTIEEKEKENMEVKEKEINNCILEKCSKCNEESIKLNLCQKCNQEKGYYPLYLNDNLPENEYINCYDKSTKYQGFYFDEKNEVFKLCHSNCKTCDYGGDGNENNCTSCKNNQILKPDIPNSTNCVTKCDFFYYYQGEKYKCTYSEKCPDKYQLEIKDKRKCIDKCQNDNTYIFQYDGECYKDIPEGTTYDEIKRLCKDINIEKCKLNEKKLNLLSNENITEYEIETKAKLYAKEFYYTNEHVTVYKNDFYSITLYKDGDCLSKLGLTIDEIDFGKCYKKITDEFGINKNLIIVIISKIINGIFITIDKLIFNPNSGEEINFMEICKNETITIKKDLKEKMKNLENIESLEELTEQGIDIFDPNSKFYTDLCFHFISPIDGRDIPVKDRIKLFFPNITLCDEGCNIKGINLTNWKAICECTLNKLIHNNIFGNNLLLQKSLGEVQDILTKTNIEVMKCYRDLLDITTYKNNTGMMIILSILFIQIIFIIIYYFKYKFKIKKYIMSITDIFLQSSFVKKNTYLINSFIMSPNNLKKSNPPKNNNQSEIKSENNNKINFERKIAKNKPKTQIIKKGKKIRGSKNIDNRKSLSQKNNFIFNISKDSNRNSNDIINFSENIKDKKNDIIQNDYKINIDEYMKTDPDDMDYDDAIREDKRTYCQYFLDKIKKEQIILSTFLKQEILKPIPLKIVLLLLNIDLYLFINALFFNENYISDLLNFKKDTFSSFINRLYDRIIIITITGVIINYVVEFFFIEDKKIRGIFKREKENIIILKYEIVQIIKNTYIRYNIFNIISCLIMLFSLYYIFCFNNVYPCIKDEWLKSSFIIISIMQILPMFLGFIDTSIRFISFKFKSERLFKLSSIFL